MLGAVAEKAEPFSREFVTRTLMGWSDLVRPGSAAIALRPFSMTLLQHAHDGGPT
jgi:hypothetical protein